MYSQNSEEAVLINYFSQRFLPNDFKGNLLDIGCNDCKTLSNSLALIERGWSAVLVEPSKVAFKKCKLLHKGRENVYCYNFAIADFCGEAVLHESGTHLGQGDTALLSTLKKSELKRWEGSSNTFTETVAKVLDWKAFLKKSKIKQFDLISLDSEGNDLLILQQMNLQTLGCKALCIEWNSVPYIKVEIEKITSQYDMELSLINGENLIYLK